MKQVSDQPPSLRSKNRLVSPDLEQVVMRALAKDPALRHSSARAMADELRRVSRGGAVSADTMQATQVISAQQAAATAVLPPPPPPAQPAGPKRSLLPWLLVVLFLVVAGGIGLVVYNQLRGNDVTVPGGLTGVTCKQAQAKLTAADLDGKCTAATSTTKKGLVFKTDPTSDASVSKNSTVRSSSSAGPDTKPCPTSRANRRRMPPRSCNAEGFTNVTIGLNRPDSPAQTGGDVVSTTPKPGTVVGPGRSDCPERRLWQRASPTSPGSTATRPGRSCRPRRWIGNLHQRSTAPTPPSTR